MKTFKCEICNNTISINGLAKYQHYQKHVKEGKLIQRKIAGGKTAYYRTIADIESGRKII